MSAKINSASPIADLGVSSPQLPRATPPAAERPASAGPAPADFRLVIEEDQDTGAFVYKTLDRRTGEVVQQFPREEVIRLKQDPGYQAGAIIVADI